MAGKALIFSAPSGSGKTTIVKRLLEKNSDLEFSISASTREKRIHSEAHGKDYYFLTQQEFRDRIAKGDFVEWEEVYNGTLYGTLKSEVERVWASGKNIAFDVDVKGGITLKNHFGNKALALFVRAPSLEVLEERLRQRGTESEESLARRLEKARAEMTFEGRFDAVIENTELQTAVAEAQRLYDAFNVK